MRPDSLEEQRLTHAGDAPETRCSCIRWGPGISDQETIKRASHRLSFVIQAYC